MGFKGDTFFVGPDPSLCRGRLLNSVKMWKDPMQSDAPGAHGAQHFGTIKNGNPSGDPSTSPRCCARTRSGKPCRAPAMWSKRTHRYTRCRLHGGASTGPRTRGGLERCRKARWRHGEFSAEEKALRRATRLFLQVDRLELERLGRMVQLYLRAKKRAEKSVLSHWQVVVASSPEDL
jgi:hypothetical protein